MAINPNRPAGQTPSPPPEPPTETVTGAPNPNGESLKVTERDNLHVAVKRGDTLFQMARLFAEDKNSDGRIAGRELSGYVGHLKAANGGAPALSVGQGINVPNRDANFKVALGIAAQKWLEHHPNAGYGAVADYDWANLQQGPAPGDAYVVHVPTLDGRRTMSLYIGDDMSDERGESFFVQTLADFRREYEAATGESLNLH